MGFLPDMYGRKNFEPMGNLTMKGGRDV